MFTLHDGVGRDIDTLIAANITDVGYVVRRVVALDSFLWRTGLPSCFIAHLNRCCRVGRFANCIQGTFRRFGIQVE